jgi:hypothetical protein
MANKKNLWGMLAAALVCGMVLLACPNDTSEEDTWSDVTSLNQLNGTWKGSYNQTMTFKEMYEAEGGTWDDDMQTMFGDMKVALSTEITIIINASAKTQKTSMTMTAVFSGGNISDKEVWKAIKTQAEGGEFDDAKHSITMTAAGEEITLDADAITEMLKAGTQINQDGTKIKQPESEHAPETTLIKQ